MREAPVRLKRWRDRAACADLELDDISPGFCRQCGVADDCLITALYDEQHLPNGSNLYFFTIRGGEMAPRRQRALNAAGSNPDEAFALLKRWRADKVEAQREKRRAADRRRRAVRS